MAIHILECPACHGVAWGLDANNRHICRTCELVPDVDLTRDALALLESFGQRYFDSQFLPAEFVADHIDEYAEEGDGE